MKYKHKSSDVRLISKRFKTFEGPKRIWSSSAIIIRDSHNLMSQLHQCEDGATTFVISVSKMFTYDEIELLSASQALYRIENIIVMGRSRAFYKTIDGVLYSADGTELFLCPSAKKNVTISSHTRSIMRYAFSGCHKITSICIPASVRFLASHSFSHMDALESVIIEPGVTHIGGSHQTSLFYSCKKLKNIVLPDSILSICESAFSGCTSLTAIQLPSKLQVIETRAFEGTNISEIVLPDSVSDLGVEALSSTTRVSLHSNHIPCGLLRALVFSFYFSGNVNTLVEIYDLDTKRYFYFPKVMRDNLMFLSDAWDAGMFFLKKPTYFMPFLWDLASGVCKTKYCIYTALAYPDDEEVRMDIQHSAKEIVKSVISYLDYFRDEIDKLCQFLQLDIVNISDLQTLLDAQKEYSDTTLIAYLMDSIHRAKAKYVNQDSFTLE